MIPVVAVGLLIIIGLLFGPRETPMSVANEFMDALARGDSKRLTELSYIGHGTAEELEKKWDFTVKVPGKYYRFTWQVRGETIESDTVATVKVDIDKGSGFADPMSIPLIKQDGKWKVDSYGLSRAIYPGLPH